MSESILGAVATGINTYCRRCCRGFRPLRRRLTIRRCHCYTDYPHRATLYTKQTSYLAPCHRDVVQNVVTTFPSIYRTRMFIAVSTTGRNWSLSCLCAVLDFCCSLNKAFRLLRCYAAKGGLKPTFQDCLFLDSLTFEDGADR